MSDKVEGKFKIENWQEETYGEIEGGGKLTRASVKQAFSGGIEGDGEVEWLLCYRADDTADFVGLQSVAGSVGERSGSFVLQVSGSFDGGEAKGDWTVVPGSGTGELGGLRGSGGFAAPLGSEAAVTLEYEFE
jgi:Protein of unknown function (DUF3224)